MAKALKQVEKEKTRTTGVTFSVTGGGGGGSWRDFEIWAS